VPDGRLGEVISVVARWRRWTVEQKLALVEEVLRPGASVAAVADRHGMSCGIRGMSATDSDLKSAGDSEMKSAIPI
jgi:transposase-like protein